MREIIIDNKTQRNLRDLGVGIIDGPLRFPTTELRAAFQRLHPELNEMMRSTYYVSMFGNGKTYYRTVHNTFHAILKPYLDQIFEHYKVPVIVAQVKGVGSSSAVNIHQDLTIVDESNYRSYVLWIPLEDSSDTNGTLSFLEGSHRVFRNYRVHTAHYMFEESEHYIIEHARKFLVEEGGALLFDPATIHFSGLNTSGKPRLSLGMEIVDSSAPLEILYDSPDADIGNMDIYRVPENFWLQYECFERERELPPSFGEKIGMKTGIRVHPYSHREFLELYSPIKP
ncbi:MAG: hypothetical protein GC178_03430 [Flavobacteriales bacterium]|nr:hypothetical protein [Flavobacteriales bacterium]